MKRSFLTALGLERGVIDRIMAEHGAAVEALKERAGESESALKQQLENSRAERENALVDDLVAQTLRTAGMNQSAIPIALKMYDRSIIEIKDGAIANAEMALERFKSEWGDFFSKDEHKSAQVGTPPAQMQSGGTMNDFILAAAGRK
jgi:hypothetical protein